MASTNYTVSGVYDSLFFNSNGCDSLVILDLTTTIRIPQLQVHSGDSYSWLGINYTVRELHICSLIKWL